MNTLLFVDDDLAFLESIQRVFKTWSAGTALNIETAHSVGDAIMILQEMPVTVVVIDIRMPVVDGLQFLRLLNRKHPNVQKAILTGYAEEEYRTACLAHGAALFLEKPRNSDEMKSVYAALVQLLEFPQARGFSGVLQQASLADMLQMLCTGGNSLILQVNSKDGLTEIFIKGGSVIHATAGTMEGYDAFYHVMTLRGGEFLTQPYAEPDKHTITSSWEFLLMESARLCDENGMQDKEEPLAPVGPIPIPKTQRIQQTRIMLAREQTGSLPPVPNYASQDEEEWSEPPVPRFDKKKETIPIEFSPIRLAQKPAPAVTHVRLDELVVCSPQGGLLKSEGCMNPSRRVDLLELFSIKMRQLTGRSEWGNLEYLTIQGADYTATVEFPRGVGAFGYVRRKGVPGADIRAAVNQTIQALPELSPARSFV
ncbi:MAG TPA: response regulator [Chthoniobacterales bacterium]|jgi:CheY-like chemotaxis protein